MRTLSGTDSPQRRLKAAAASVAAQTGPSRKRPPIRDTGSPGRESTGPLAGPGCVPVTGDSPETASIHAPGAVAPDAGCWHSVSGPGCIATVAQDGGGLFSGLLPATRWKAAADALSEGVSQIMGRGGSATPRLWADAKVESSEDDLFSSVQYRPPPRPRHTPRPAPPSATGNADPFRAHMLRSCPGLEAAIDVFDEHLAVRDKDGFAGLKEAVVEAHSRAYDVSQRKAPAGTDGAVGADSGDDDSDVEENGEGGLGIVGAFADLRAAAASYEEPPRPTARPEHWQPVAPEPGMRLTVAQSSAPGQHPHWMVVSVDRLNGRLLAVAAPIRFDDGIADDESNIAGTDDSAGLHWNMLRWYCYPSSDLELLVPLEDEPGLPDMLCDSLLTDAEQRVRRAAADLGIPLDSLDAVDYRIDLDVAESSLCAEACDDAGAGSDHACRLMDGALMLRDVLAQRKAAEDIMAGHARAKLQPRKRRVSRAAMATRGVALGETVSFALGDGAFERGVLDGMSKQGIATVLNPAGEAVSCPKGVLWWVPRPTTGASPTSTPAAAHAATSAPTARGDAQRIKATLWAILRASIIEWDRVGMPQARQLAALAEEATQLASLAARRHSELRRRVHSKNGASWASRLKEVGTDCAKFATAMNDLFGGLLSASDTDRSSALGSLGRDAVIQICQDTAPLHLELMRSMVALQVPDGGRSGSVRRSRGSRYRTVRDSDGEPVREWLTPAAEQEKRDKKVATVRREHDPIPPCRAVPCPALPTLPCRAAISPQLRALPILSYRPVPCPAVSPPSLPCPTRPVPPHRAATPSRALPIPSHRLSAPL